MSASQPHIPVMLAECLEGLAVSPEQWFVDATFGAGGHSRAILLAGANVLAIDQDPNARAYADALKNEFPERFLFTECNFRDLAEAVSDAGISLPAGILMDLGISSMQIDEAERGFAFRQDGPLDMRMSAQGESAFDVVNTYAQDDLAALIYKYGEERHSRRIARSIVYHREKSPIETTEQLANVILQGYPGGGYRRDHPARRTFQALRIYVNDELGALEEALVASERVLKNDGRLVVMSYHSLEDRIVKHFIKNSALLERQHKKPLVARDEEIAQNPRARSAKLRVAVKRENGDAA